MRFVSIFFFFQGCIDPDVKAALMHIIQLRSESRSSKAVPQPVSVQENAEVNHWLKSVFISNKFRWPPSHLRMEAISGLIFKDSNPHHLQMDLSFYYWWRQVIHKILFSIILYISLLMITCRELHYYIAWISHHTSFSHPLLMCKPDRFKPGAILHA